MSDPERPGENRVCVRVCLLVSERGELAAISLAGVTSYTMHLQVVSERKKTKQRGPPAEAEVAVT